MIITGRRFYLDRFLNEQISHMRGNILDIGGKKERRRGNFCPPLSQVQSWRYVNLDPVTNPDFLCSAEEIPLPDESIDGFLLCEVLEHLEHPEKVLQEAYRLLRKRGRGWITMPFLFQVHADPYDYQRWTADKLRQTLQACGFIFVDVNPMGSVAIVIHDLLRNIIWKSPNRTSFHMRVFAKVLKWTIPVFFKIDNHLQHLSPYMTSGWCAVVQK